MSSLITPTFVASRLHAPDVILLDATLPPVGVTPRVDTRSQYLAAHLPGALFFDIEELSNTSTSLPHMLPTPEQFARDMSRMGVSDGATLVVYEQTDVFSAPRAWWMLRCFGARNVFLLEGGIRAWMAAGLPVEEGPVDRPPATFHAQLAPAAVKSLSDMQKLIAQQAQILDARSRGRFEGTAPEPRAGLRSGHMPGAVSLPYTDLIRGNFMKSADELATIFRAKRVDLGEPITTTCGSGVTAAVIALGLEICGASQVSLYDGSWAEYAQGNEQVVEGAG